MQEFFWRYSDVKRKIKEYLAVSACSKNRNLCDKERKKNTYMIFIYLI